MAITKLGTSSTATLKGWNPGSIEIYGNVPVDNREFSMKYKIFLKVCMSLCMSQVWVLINFQVKKIINHCYIFQVSEKIDAVLILIISVIH